MTSVPAKPEQQKITTMVHEPAPAPKPAPAPPTKRTLSFAPADDYADKLSVLLYGPPKTGKSVAAASAPGPILYVSTDSPTALRFARRKYGSDTIHEYRFTGKQSFNDIALYLRDGAPERTVVLDTVGGIYQTIGEEIDPNMRLSAPQRGDMNTLILRFCRHLINDCSQNVVLVCHEDINVSDEGRQLMPRTGGKQLPQSLSAMVDVIGYTRIVTDDKGQDHFTVQISADDLHYAGNRDGVLDRIVRPDISAWVKAYAEAAKPPAKEKK